MNAIITPPQIPRAARFVIRSCRSTYTANNAHFFQLHTLNLSALTPSILSNGGKAQGIRTVSTTAALFTTGHKAHDQTKIPFKDPVAKMTMKDETATSIPKVEYRQLGKCGLRVSVPILGAMSLGDKRWQAWTIEESEVGVLSSNMRVLKSLSMIGLTAAESGLR